MESTSRVAQAVRQALMMSAAISATGIAMPAFAQDVNEELEIVVTGSRIRSANLETTAPVTSVTSEDVTRQGVTRVEDLVNQLPQAFAAQNATVANGASGTATVNLRGLGSARTLVLVDGRRMPYGGVGQSAADLNQIPAQMVERVEVLTGGASAVYGSDALAGVVNFIMKKDYEGVEVSGQYSFYQHNNDFGGPGNPKFRDVIATRAATNPSQFQLPDDNVTDGFGKEFSVMMGVSSGDGKGNMTFSATAIDIDQVLQRDRDFSACSLAANTVGQFRCGGSGTAYPGTFTQNFVTNYTVNSAGSGNTFRPFSSSLDQYNFGPVNHYLRPERRYSLGVNGHYEFNEHADVYAQAMFTDYKSIAQIAPGGAFFDTSTINCDNPMLSAQQLTTIGCVDGGEGMPSSVPLYIGRRNVEGGGRQQSFHNVSWRAVAGVRGAIDDVWNYDVSMQYSSVTNDQMTLNYFVIDRLKRAVDVVSVGGVPTCRSVVDGSDPNCVPYNVFQIGGVTQGALDYLQAPGIQTGYVTQEIYNGTVAGDLSGYGWKLPGATDGVQVVFGAEYRRDYLTNETDALLATAALSGTGGAQIGIEGSTQVKELFFEGRLPIMQGQPWAEQLGLDAAYRYSDYGDFTTNTYKFGGDWAPTADFRFRASYQRAVRAANIIELFTAQGFNLFDLDGDPCGWNLNTPDPENDNPLVNAVLPTALAQACQATGVPTANLGSSALDSPAGQYNFLQGGNPALSPETSDTVSFGFVFTPTFFEGFTASIDWFNIRIEDTISTFGAENTLNACYGQGDAAACGRIERNAANGTLWVGDGNVIDLNINIGALETTGIDVNLNYSGLEIGKAGSLAFNLTGTYLDELITEPGPGIDPYDCVGYFASVCGTPNPEWRHQARMDWQTPWDINVSLAWRYYGSVSGYGQKYNADGTLTNRIDQNFAAESYFDLSGTWNVTEKSSIVLGINNILDNDPSINASVGTTGNGNTYPQVYDALGRYIFVRAKIAF